MITPTSNAAGLPAVLFVCDVDWCENALVLTGEDGPQVRRIASATGWRIDDTGTTCRSHHGPATSGMGPR